MICRHTLLVLCSAALSASALDLSWLTDAASNINILAKTRQQMLGSSSKSWEMGTAAQALLEYRWSDLSVYNSSVFPLPSTLSSDYNASDVLDIANAVVSQKAPDAKALTTDGSAGDPASLGVAVLLANWTMEDKSNKTFATAAEDQLHHLLNDVPRSPNGGISHREDEVQLWSDSVYMVPPFIAFYGALQNDLGILKESYNQIKAYHDVLSDNQTKLWKHVMLGTWEDQTHWLTGNGWAAAGMMRVLATMNHSSLAGELKQEQSDIEGWIKDILYSVWEYQADTGGLSNTIDMNNATETFQDTAGTALLTSVTYRLSTFKKESTLIAKADKGRAFVRGHVSTSTGQLSGAVDPYKFNVPLEEGQVSPEGQAFVLMMEAARRDWTSANRKNN